MTRMYPINIGFVESLLSIPGVSLSKFIALKYFSAVATVALVNFSVVGFRLEGLKKICPRPGFFQKTPG